MRETEYEFHKSNAAGLLAALARDVAAGVVEIPDDYYRARVLETGLALSELWDEVKA